MFLNNELYGTEQEVVSPEGINTCSKAAVSPVGIYLCSRLTIKIPERCHWCRSGIFINFEHISHLVLLFLLLTLNM